MDIQDLEQEIDNLQSDMEQEVIKHELIDSIITALTKGHDLNEDQQEYLNILGISHDSILEVDNG